MLKLTYCLHRLPSLTRAEFQRIWGEDHAPLVRAAAPHLGIARYVQSHTLEHPVASAGAAARAMPAGDGEDFDGVAELWFDEAGLDGEPSGEALRHGRILAEDEARFIDFARSRLFFTRENVVIGG